MCFSAAASFTASAIITSMGVVAHKKSKNKTYQLLAYVPIIFGIHQFLEGWVWLSLQNADLAFLNVPVTYAFMLVAWVVWPIYMPFTLWKLEKGPLRRKILGTITVLGTLTMFLLVYIITHYGIKSEVLDCSIYYDYGVKHPMGWIVGAMYVLTTSISTLVSSVKKMWVMGLLNLGAYVFSKLYYNVHIISVWCFFAALISIVILYIIVHLKKEEVAS
jgi:hypothetical protein